MTVQQGDTDNDPQGLYEVASALAEVSTSLDWIARELADSRWMSVPPGSCLWLADADGNGNPGRGVGVVAMRISERRLEVMTERGSVTRIDDRRELSIPH